MANIVLPHNGWKPREDQAPLWQFLEQGGKQAVCINHRRWGKDEIALHHAAVSAVKRVGTYWHMLPEAAQARKAIWNAVNPRTGKRRIDDAFPHEMRENINESEMFIRFKNGSTWQVVGSDNYDSLVGAAPVGVVWSEYAIADPESYGYLSPILAENGGWALFISTSRGNNHLWRQYDLVRALMLVDPANYYAEMVTARMTKVFDPLQLEKERQSLIALYGEEHGESKYQQEYMCSRDGAVFGNYYSKQMQKARDEKRITKVPASTGHEVYTFWDLGVDDSTSIWFMQFVGKETRVIDYYENTGMGMAHYAGVLKDKGYKYGDHYMPHDADYREMGMGEYAQTPKEMAENLGIRPIQVVPRARDTQTVIAHIGMVRNALDMMWFDEEKCFKAISALESYRADYDEKKKKLDNKPLHDWSSHACLVGSTKITLVDGIKDIKDVVVGDKVLLLTGEVGNVSASELTDHVLYTTTIKTENGDLLEGTPNHPIFTTRGVIGLGKIKINDRVISSAFKKEDSAIGFRDRFEKCDYYGNYKTSRVVEVIHVPVLPTPVYNLTVDRHHCYLANGILVSNCDAMRTFAVGYAPRRRGVTRRERPEDIAFY